MFDTEQNYACNGMTPIFLKATALLPVSLSKERHLLTVVWSRLRQGDSSSGLSSVLTWATIHLGEEIMLNSNNNFHNTVVPFKAFL